MIQPLYIPDTPSGHDVQRAIDRAHRLRALWVRDRLAWTLRFTRHCLAEIQRKGTISSDAFRRIVDTAGPTA